MAKANPDRAVRRALLIGDIHTEVELLATVLSHAESVDKVLSVGDIVDGPHDPLACIALLREHDVDVVRGNHERWVIEGHPFEPFDYPQATLAWLRTLPSIREYDTPTGRFLLGHGIASNDMLRLEPDTDGYALECLEPVSQIVRERRFRWVAGGHTHVPMVRTIEGVTFLNPGTLVHHQNPGFMIVDFSTGIVERWLLPSAKHSQVFRVDL
jgi:predicted phosphodiesterase